MQREGGAGGQVRGEGGGSEQVLNFETRSEQFQHTFGTLNQKGGVALPIFALMQRPNVFGESF